MNATVKKVWNAVSSILVALVMLLALLLVGARVIGLQVYTVLSGSMEPTYHTGSLIYVKKVDPFTIQEGQVITFMLDENTIATHRVVGIVPDEEDSSVIRFRTKGDANDAEDGSLVHYKNVIGVPVFTIPYLGYLASYIQNPPGMYIAISAAAILLLLVFIPDIFASDKKKDQEKAEAKEKKPSRKHKKKDSLPEQAAPAAQEDAEAPAEILAMSKEVFPNDVPLPDDAPKAPTPAEDSFSAAAPVEQGPAPQEAPAQPEEAPAAEPAPAAPEQETLTEQIRRKTEGLLTDDEVEEVRRMVVAGKFDRAAAEALRELLIRRDDERSAAQ